MIVLWVAGAAAALYAIHRLACWAEDRGWIYWRKKPRGSVMGSVLSGFEVVTNPGAEHVIVAKDAKRFEERQNGDGDPPGIVG